MLAEVPGSLTKAEFAAEPVATPTGAFMGGILGAQNFVQLPGLLCSV